MARYAAGHKLATRQRIIEAAGRRFKRDGIHGSGIATLMADAGLTTGGFYAHFASKVDLVAATVADQLGKEAERYAELVRRPGGVEALIRQYLSPQHRDDPGLGCPSAALLCEIARSDESVKRAYTDGLLAQIDVLAAQLTPRDPRASRAAVLVVFAAMVGTVQLARALADPAMADEVLDHGIGSALAALTAAPR